eukprot:2992654-Pleurochrysis_carterae.AAC.1
MHSSSLVNTGLRPRRSEAFETRKRMAMIDELLKAESRARSLRSSSTNSGARVAVLMAASLIRGCSLLLAVSSGRAATETCCDAEARVDYRLAVEQLLLEVGNDDGEAQRLVGAR